MMSLKFLIISFPIEKKVKTTNSNAFKMKRSFGDNISITDIKDKVLKILEIIKHNL